MKFKDVKPGSRYLFTIPPETQGLFRRIVVQVVQKGHAKVEVEYFGRRLWVEPGNLSRIQRC